MAITDRELAEYIGSLLADLRKLSERNERLKALARLIEVAEKEAVAISKQSTADA